MRISDWSSDVCSSDLLREGRHRKAVEAAGAGRNRPAVERAPPCLRDRRLGLAHRQRLLLRADRCRSLALARGRLRAGPAAAGARRTGAAAQRRDRRSEEHTSELQSLMRISYAVFCLKKKNAMTII